MNVDFDLYTSESALVARGAMDSVLDELRSRAMVYTQDGAVWLRTGEFGDSADRVLVKSDGEPTYFLPDIAYHHEKFSRGDLVIDILGADHHGYVPRMRAALGGFGPPFRRLRDADRPERHPAAGRGRGAPVQAGRRHGARRGPARRGGARRDPGWCTCSSPSTPPRPSTSTWCRLNQPRTPSTTCSTRTPASTRWGGRPRRATFDGRRWTMWTCRCSCTSVSWTCCGPWRPCPTRWWLRRGPAPRTR